VDPKRASRKTTCARPAQTILRTSQLDNNDLRKRPLNTGFCAGVLRRLAIEVAQDQRKGYVRSSAALKWKRAATTATQYQDPADIQPCVHHWLVAPDEDWCDCDGTQHYHAWCRECGDERTFPRIVAWTLWDPEAADVIMEKGRRLA